VGSLYGFEIRSELPLRRLNAARGSRGVLTVERADAPLTPPRGEPTGSQITDEGYRWFASYELDGGNCLLQMPPTGSFLLEPGAGRIVVESSAGDPELLEHRIASSAICTMLSQRDDLVLHAAAVETEGRAIVFCGPTLRGKSTLARALGDAGCRLLGEDGIAIGLEVERAIAYPGARGVRLRGLDGDGRRRTDLLGDPGPGEPSPSPVAAVVMLGERGQRFEVETLEPAPALALLTPNLIHTGGRGPIASAFGRLARLLSTAPAFRIALPDDLGALPAAARSFLDSTGIRG
jgi:hypothetical protein